MRDQPAGLNCPGCGEPAVFAIGPEQAFCDNDDCSVLLWDPSLSVTEKYFDRDGTWARPDNAVAVDVLAQAGGGGSAPGRDGEDGEIAVKRFYAPKIPPTVDIEIGKGGRPGGRDGYVLVVTHLADDGGGQP